MKLRCGWKIIWLIWILMPLVHCNWMKGPDYTVTVIVEEGVKGNPESGTYTHQEFEQILYEYNPVAEGAPIEVLLDDKRKAFSGTLTVYNNYELRARILDIRGTWTMTITRDNVDESVEVTFYGSSITQGTYSDDRGYEGTWDITDNTLTMVFTNWIDYVFTAGIADMQGDWNGDGTSGLWTMSRNE